MKNYFKVLLLQLKLCFIFFASPGLKGGDLVRDGNFKHQVSIKLWNTMSTHCGGSIIDEEFVLTSATCAMPHGKKITLLKVIARRQVQNDIEVFEIDVEKIYVPRGYSRVMSADGIFIKDDIAVLKLSNSLMLERNTLLGKIDLPERNSNYNEGPAKISGYGESQQNRWMHNTLNRKQTFHPQNTASRNILSSTYWLRYANVTVFRNSQCTRNSKMIVKVTNQMICGQVVPPGGVCRTDRGNGLISGNTIIGVLSLEAQGCNEADSHSVYTKVLSYLKFIHRAKTQSKITTGMRIYDFKSDLYKCL
ncbi:chymotrypsin-like elastase family member 1 [Copidosoma floridanum]|uniref:chymotrypsin-like elastase family member 1 n=1 Tax=Copidosoma floridanum TaxID=29053 RepID=UPI0006C986E1|nr:chymotrypsin-like elastase family member 1 [Copidosoma floridanum]